MPKPGATGANRIIHATGYSMKGLRAAWKYESAFRQEVMLAVVLLPAAFWLGQTAVERALLIAPILLMLIVELLNSAIEALADRFGPENHPLLGNAKDMGSAAVLLALLLLGAVWLLIGWARFA